MSSYKNNNSLNVFVWDNDSIESESWEYDQDVSDHNDHNDSDDDESLDYDQDVSDHNDSHDDESLDYDQDVSDHNDSDDYDQYVSDHDDHSDSESIINEDLHDDSNYVDSQRLNRVNKNIIIYAHRTFFLSDGGIVVQYYLASILDSMGINVKICNVHDNNAKNDLFNKFITVDEISNSVDFENTIVIYCEGVIGNPLKAKYVVRWMLSKLGQNVPVDFVDTWDNNELIYFFNSEMDIIDDNIYDAKYLSLFYINPIFKNNNLDRNGLCFTIRKRLHDYLTIHEQDSFEITKEHSQNDYLDIFNKHEKFIAYDPLTFLSIIAIKCGCISIICPIQGVSKKEYFKMTAFYDYMVEKNIDSIYGLAYGNSEDELNYAKATLHLFEEQLIDINNWFIGKYINNFVNDIINWNSCNNTLFNYKNYFIQMQMKKELHDEFDIDFYRTYNSDLSDMSILSLINHYSKWGKNEGRVTSQKQLNELIASTGQPDFDLDFYKNYHKDLSSFHVCKLVEHYNKWGKNEGRVTSQKQLNELIASTGEPDFDVDFYKNYHIDLSSFHVCKLVEHYNKWGKNEGRIISQKQLKQFIVSTGQPDFDVKFYRNYYTDLKDFNIRRLIHHYNNWGKNEGRVTSQKQLNELIASTGEPDFDVDFYKNYHKDLTRFHVCKLVEHYNKWGKNEGRFFCEKQLKQEQFDELIVSIGNVNPNFDPEFYTMFNKGSHVIENFQIVNDNYFTYDFTVGEDYNYGKINILDKNLIHCHHHFRTIDNFADLLEYNKKYIKKYYFFNKESFYRYYNDFDYEYYKNRYFNDNNEITENEVLFYYHSKGKYKCHVVNNKITFVVYSPPYDIKCGGILVMHYLVKLINEIYNNKYQAKLFMVNNIRYDNPFCNEFARIDEINDNTIVIYPEIVSGNPLNAKHVVRWILLELGIEMPLDHYKKWGLNDLVYHWETKENTTNYKQLSCPFMNPIFKNVNNAERTKTCYLVKKGPLIHKNINYMHPPNSVCIDKLSLQEINNIFNECKFFYTYDANTAYIIYATICGCIPIIYPIDGISEKEYFKNRMYNFHDVIYNKAIVYGNDANKINYILENKLNENNKEYYQKLFDLYQITTISKFLEEMYLHIDKNFQLNNTVKEIFLSDII